MTSPERFSRVIFAGNELQNRTKGVCRAAAGLERRGEGENALFGSYFYDLLLCVALHGALLPSPHFLETPIFHDIYVSMCTVAINLNKYAT